MTIHVLPASVAAQIAAGEVIERPASIIKELLENSIDADASQITVSIHQDAVSLIRVTDDGNGIPDDQLALAFERHATSKLRSASDLQTIATLGFRGEALPSIAAVSRITCVSRTADQNAARRIRVEFSQLTEPPTPAGAAVGTSTTVLDLFQNQPARLKFLKTRNTELAHSRRVVERYAMARPDIRFTFRVGEAEQISTHGTGKLRETLLEIMGSENTAAMLPLLHVSRGISVTGYTSNTDLHRSNRNEVTIFVNGRSVQDSNLAWAIEKAYDRQLPQGRHPIAVVHISMPADQVDVNAHPTKQEVRFHSETAVFNTVQTAVKESLIAHGAIHTALPRPFGPLASARQSEPDLPRPAPTPQAPHYRSPLSSQPQPDRFPGTRPDPRPDAPSATESSSTAEPFSRPPMTQVIPHLTLVGQSQLTFILADGSDGMIVIDQHAAHERVLYDRIIRARHERAIGSQRLMFPEPIQLDPLQAAVLEEHLTTITGHGYQVTGSGADWILESVPDTLTQHHNSPPAAAFQQLIDEFATQGAANDPNHTAAATIACHSAVRAGDRLDHATMSAILRQLLETTDPHQCPHGRPTMISIPRTRLDREFQRT